MPGLHAAQEGWGNPLTGTRGEALRKTNKGRVQYATVCGCYNLRKPLRRGFKQSAASKSSHEAHIDNEAKKPKHGAKDRAIMNIWSSSYKDNELKYLFHAGEKKETY
jgi:hypothetical protein